MTDYERLLARIYETGEVKTDRTGTGTKSLFGQQMRFSLVTEFPLITSKKVFFKGVVHELLWIISGDTNIKYLTDNNIHIWDEWADDHGNLGPVYGAQWRNHYFFDTDGDCRVIDQLGNAINTIKNDPDSRRILINSWNVGEIYQMALPPCHMTFQFYVSPEGYLSCHLYQRSADMFLGVPFNIASYALLTYMVAEVTGLKPGELVWTGGDCHIYLNHLKQVEEQLARPDIFYLPKLELTHRDSIDDFTYEDVHLINYESHPAIKADVAV